MNLVADRLGIGVEFVSGPTWNEFMQMLGQGDIDVMLNIIPTLERKRQFDFTTLYLETDAGIYTHQNIKGIKNLHDLAGLRVAVTKGFVYEELLSNHYPDIKLVLLRDLKQCLDAVTFGEADATVGMIGVVNYMIKSSFIPNVKMVAKVKDSYFSSKMGIAVNKNNTILRDILQKGSDAISEQEMQALNEIWNMKTKESFRTILSEEEKEFLYDIKEIRMCVIPDWMPLESIDSDGRHIGMIAEIINLLEDRLPIPIRLVKTKTWEGTLQSAQERKCDIVSGIIHTKEREEYLNFSAPYLNLPLVIATTKEKYFIDSLGGLKGNTFGVIKGYAFLSVLRHNYPLIDFIEVDSVRDGLEKVHSGQLYGFVDTLAVIVHAIKKYDIIDIKISGRLDEKIVLGIGMRNDWPQLFSIFNKVLAKVGKEPIQEIYNNQTAVQVVQEFDYSILWKYLAGIGIVFLFIIYRYRKLKSFNQKLEEISVTDQLTGIYNRRKLNAVLSEILDKSIRYNRPFSVIITDVDNFKAVNDTFGHHVGDEVLKKMTQLIQTRIRKTDTFGRWGGVKNSSLFVMKLIWTRRLHLLSS